MRNRVDQSGSHDRKQGICHDLKTAVRTGSVAVYAQSQIDLASGAIMSVEIQPTWPTREGSLRHDEVFAITDDANLLQSLDMLAFRWACTLASNWHGCGKVAIPRVSFQFLSPHLTDEQLVETVIGCLDAAGVREDTLDLQLSGSMLDRRRRAARVMQARGLSITLADFGLERFSLSDLYALKPDRIKIHPSLVKGVACHRGRAAIVRAIVALAHTLEANAIASGISSSEDLQFLQWESCDIGQGKALSKAVLLWPA
ncbi:EAL domain-containing protein [Paraburkholderia sp. C35]|uniref:EAL domain-containing protein n=1 Tax=Paraburkholderia sp. C35 TaxID=2126993 RepID=UPI000D6924C8|nr:EAL domain-containing protein [Paraburkholderia sp. C35]